MFSRSSTATDRPERRTHDTGGTGVPDGRRRLSAELLSQSLLTRQELLTAVRYAERRQVPFAEAVVTCGFVSEHECYSLLSRLLNVPLIDLAEPPNDAAALRLLTGRVAWRHRIAPVTTDARSFTYATASPYDDAAARDVAFCTSRQPKAVLARPSQIRKALNRLYPAGRAVLESQADGPLDSNASPIDLCQQLLGRALKSGASAVHVEPTSGGAVVKYRTAGAMETVMILRLQKVQPVVNRLKVLARADIAVRHRPQEGTFKFKGERAGDFRLATQPTVHGEAVVLHVIGTDDAPRTLDALGYEPDVVATLGNILTKPDGIVLIAGPPRSGKTTLTYAALAHAHERARVVVSIEAPVERQIEGIRQIAADERHTTIATAMVLALRQDPSVLALSDISDAPVAQLVGRTASTGRLVVGAVQATDSMAALARLRNLGLEPFRLAESLRAVIALRLVRTLCRGCRVMHSEIEARRMGEAHGLRSLPAQVGNGCQLCRKTGYAGKTPLIEVFVPNEHVRDLIAQDARATDIRQAAYAGGWIGLRDAALGLVGRGITTIEEAERTLAADSAAVENRSAAAGKVIAYSWAARA